MRFDEAGMIVGHDPVPRSNRFVPNPQAPLECVRWRSLSGTCGPDPDPAIRIWTEAAAISAPDRSPIDR